MTERRFRHRDEEITVEVERDGNVIVLRRSDGGGPLRLEACRVGTAEYVLRDPDDEYAMHALFAVRDGDQYWIHLDGRTHLLERVRQRGSGSSVPGSLVAPTPGTVDEVLVSDGDTVQAGQVLLVMTSMKMQIEIKAPHDGTVSGMSLSVGDQVAAGVALLQVDAVAVES